MERSDSPDVLEGRRLFDTPSKVRTRIDTGQKSIPLRRTLVQKCTIPIDNDWITATLEKYI